MSFKLHPLVEAWDFDAGTGGWRRGRFDLRIANELATWPHCPALEISVDPGRDVEHGKTDDAHFVVSKSTGVRCGRVLKAIDD